MGNFQEWLSAEECNLAGKRVAGGAWLVALVTSRGRRDLGAGARSYLSPGQERTRFLVWTNQAGDVLSLIIYQYCLTRLC